MKTLYLALITLISTSVFADGEILQKPQILLVGIICKTSNDPEKGPKDIPALWTQFAKENVPAKIKNKTSNDIIALYCDYEGDHTKPHSVIIGCPVTSFDKIPEGMVAKTIPSGSYSLFRAIGEHPVSLIQTWGAIWQKSDLKRSYKGDYELYSDKFFSSSPQEIEVYIGAE